MMTLIIGVPDSGKSALAESLVLEQSPEDKRIYIATMIPYGEEGQRRIKKHRKLREGKGFVTVEAPLNVAEAAGGITGISEATCLLECVSNLVGNVMHEGDVGGDDRDLVTGIVSDIKRLSAECKNLVVVTNSFPKNGEGYDDDTIRYVELVELVNRELMSFSDIIYEYKKGEWSCREHI